MPEISRFYGIVVKIFFGNEHNPPHIHAIYGEYIGSINIETGELITGDLPPRATRLIKEWINQDDNKQLLLEIWNTQKFKKLPPLK